MVFYDTLVLQKIKKEGKIIMKKWISTLLVGGLLAAGCGIIYITSTHPAFIGTPHPVVVDGFEIKPGETTVSELSQAGFQISDRDAYFSVPTADGKVSSGYSEFYSLDTEVEGKSYYEGLILVKEDEDYAYIEVVNESPSAKKLGEAKVREVEVYDYQEKADQACLEGISFHELTQEGLTAKAGQPKSVETDAGEDYKGTKATWSKGNYEMEVEWKSDGTVSSFCSVYERD